MLNVEKNVIPGFNPGGNKNNTGKINSNVSGEDLDRDFEYGELDTKNGVLVKKVAEEIIRLIKEEFHSINFQAKLDVQLSLSLLFPFVNL